MHAELRALRARNDAIVAHSDDLVIVCRQDGTVEWASPAAKVLLEVEPQDLIGVNALKMIHLDDRERAFADFSSITRLGDHVRTDFRVLRRSGEVRGSSRSRRT